MRRFNVGFEAPQYYPVKVPSLESISRLLVPMAVSLPGFDVEMAMRDITSAFRLLLLHPALAWLMCEEFPGGFLGRSRELVFFYLVVPFGRNGSPANFAIFRDAISCMRAQFGMGRHDWVLYIPLLSKLYVDDGLLFNVRGEIRQHANALMWESITLGLLGCKSPNLSKLEEGEEEDGQWRNLHTMMGFEIDSKSLCISLPEAKIAGARVLSDQLGEREKNGTRALVVSTLHQIRGNIGHFRASNITWEFPTGPIDLLLRYTDEKATWANRPTPEVWDSFRSRLSLIFYTMQSESQRGSLSQGSLLRFPTP